MHHTEQKIQEILRRLERLESIVLRTKSRAGERRQASGAKNPKSLRDYLLNLKGSSFFRDPKSSGEVSQKIQKVYPCEPKRVGVELIRLHRKKQLRKTSKEIGGKKVVAYVG